MHFSTGVGSLLIKKAYNPLKKDSSGEKSPVIFSFYDPNGKICMINFPVQKSIYSKIYVRMLIHLSLLKKIFLYFCHESDFTLIKTVIFHRLVFACAFIAVNSLDDPNNAFEM